MFIQVVPDSPLEKAKNLLSSVLKDKNCCRWVESRNTAYAYTCLCAACVQGLCIQAEAPQAVIDFDRAAPGLGEIFLLEGNNFTAVCQCYLLQYRLEFSPVLEAHELQKLVSAKRNKNKYFKAITEEARSFSRQLKFISSFVADHQDQGAG